MARKRNRRTNSKSPGKTGSRQDANQQLVMNASSSAASSDNNPTSDQLRATLWTYVSKQQLTWWLLMLALTGFAGILGIFYNVMQHVYAGIDERVDGVYAALERQSNSMDGLIASHQMVNINRGDQLNRDLTSRIDGLVGTVNQVKKSINQQYATDSAEMNRNYQDILDKITALENFPPQENGPFEAVFKWADDIRSKVDAFKYSEEEAVTKLVAAVKEVEIRYCGRRAYSERQDFKDLKLDPKFNADKIVTRIGGFVGPVYSYSYSSECHLHFLYGPDGQDHTDIVAGRIREFKERVKVVHLTDAPNFDLIKEPSKEPPEYSDQRRWAED